MYCNRRQDISLCFVDFKQLSGHSFYVHAFPRFDVAKSRKHVFASKVKKDDKFVTKQPTLNFLMIIYKVAIFIIAKTH